MLNVSFSQIHFELIFESPIEIFPFFGCTNEEI